MNRALPLLLLVALAGALALRLPVLDRRPFHNDEGINAFKLQGLWERGEYRYDPHEYHGPTLYYCSLPFVWLSGARDFDQVNERALRWVTVAFGVGLILLLWLLREGLGKAATGVAAGLTAFSPAMVFYSRYFIHEMLLVFFTGIFLAAVWRYTRSHHVGWAIAAGASLGLMYATKETFVLAVGAMVLALGLTLAWNRWRGDGRWDGRTWVKPSHLVAGLAASLVVAVVFFTSFFANLRGPLDAVLTYLPWLSRASGHSPHIHPWHFYFERLFWFHRPDGPIWSEGLILLLAVAGCVAAFARRPLADGHTFFLRFIGFYTLVLAAVYSTISYKTPWCMLGFLHGMILLAGVGAVELVRAVRVRAAQVAVVGVLVVGGAQLGWQAWRAGLSPAVERDEPTLAGKLAQGLFRGRVDLPFAASPQNPYVYAQTLPGVLPLVERIKGIARVNPDGAQMLVKVAAPESEYWPLPWYLRELERVWWTDSAAGAHAPVMVISPAFRAYLDEATNQRWRSVGFYQMRPGWPGYPGVFFELYVESGLWTNYVESLSRPKQE